MNRLITKREKDLIYRMAKQYNIKSKKIISLIPSLGERGIIALIFTLRSFEREPNNKNRKYL